MTPTHTPGRLQVPEPYDGQHAVIVENDCGRYAVAVSIRNPADARRLAACWNACANIPTEALERVEGDTTPVFELLMQTTRERDALRPALNNLLNTVNQYDDGDYYLGTDAEQILAEANRVSIETAEPAPPPDTTTMPTGYTASVADGTTTTLRAFALQCARAFGATVTMRDDPMSAEIPERFEPNGFYRRLMEQAVARLRHLQALSPIEAQREMQQQHSAAMARWRERTWDDACKRVRYLAMIDAVCDWEPPTPDHRGLRSFMLKQLDESFTFDCCGKYLQMPHLQRWPEWLAAQIREAEFDTDRYADHHVNENERAATRTAWVRELRASLPRMHKTP